MQFPTPQGTVLVLLLDFKPGVHLLWAWTRFLLGRWAWARMAGVRFVKVLGSGFEGGFGIKPSLTRQGLFCELDSEASLEAFLLSGRVQAFRRHAREFCWLKLCAYSSRGQWSGHPINAGPAAPAPQGPVVSLTRASIRPSRALRFWSRAPAAEQALQQAQGCLLSVGLGEAPLLRQATLSVWNSVQQMDAYARSGAHLEAIRAAYSGQHFSESMFVRFALLAWGGTWKGRCYG